MSSLHDTADEYLALRRALGFKLTRHARLLPDLVEHLEAAGQTTVTTALAVEWAARPAGRLHECTARLQVARGFARYLRTLDGIAEVPPTRLLAPCPSRRIPYLYTEQQIASLVDATSILRPAFRAATYRTLLGLLAVTGMRVGEAIALDRPDIDLPAGSVTVRAGKFGAARQLPLHATTVEALADYDQLRGQRRPRAGSAAFLRVDEGHPATPRQRSPRVPRAARDSRDPRDRRRPSTADSRPAAHVRGQHAGRLIPRRRQRRRQDSATVRLPRARSPGRHLLVSPGDVRPPRIRSPAPGAHGRSAMTLLAPTMQAFFTERLITQRPASAHTIASYRDTFRLLLAFAQQQTGRPPSRLVLEDLDARLINAFLEHLERDRGCGARTRNTRLSAVHSLFHYAALRHPEHAALIARVLAIPPKRTDRPLVTFLTEPEIEALLATPDRSSWLGRRDHALPLLAIQTGLRVSELASLRCGDVALDRGAHVRCQGKGRKQRLTPLTSPTVAVLRAWLRERAGEPDDPLFPTIRGEQLSRDAIERLLAKHVRRAQQTCASLQHKRVSPHVLRHTTAMRLLHAGVDTTVIALWLGHEDTRTTQVYLHADLVLKKRALARTTPPNTHTARYRGARHASHVPGRPVNMPRRTRSTPSGHRAREPDAA